MKINPPFIAGCIAFALALFKLIVGLFSSSIAVLSSAIDSLFDCLISILNYFCYIKVEEKANDRFNFGYGKIEALMAMFEGLIIALSGCYILYASCVKFFSPSEEIKLDSALLVMLLSILVTALLVFYLNRAAEKNSSLIIKADALHYKTDLYTNFAVIAALIIIKFTSFYIIDAIFGLFVSFYIIYSASFLIKDSIYILLDGAIDRKHEEEIKNIIINSGLVKDFHSLRSRKAPKYCFLTVDFVFEENTTLKDAHKASVEIEKEIRNNFKEFKWIIVSHFDLEDDSEGDLQ